MNFLSLVMFGVVFAHAYCSLAKTDWFKYRLEERKFRLGIGDIVFKSLPMHFGIA